MKFQMVSLIAIALLISIVFIRCSKFTNVDLPDKTLMEKVYAERTKDGAYVLTFLDSSGFDSYSVYQGTAPDKINWSKAITADSVNPLILTDYDLNNRYFFGIKNKNNDQLIVSERLIQMDGASNFRDMGGIPAAEGKIIKWGKLYRSGKLSDLSSDDLKYFKTLDIKTVIDFRDNREIKENPNHFPDQYIVKQVRIPIGDEEGNMQHELEKTIKRANPENFNTEEFVGDVMRQFIDTFAYQYKPFIEYVSNTNNTPLLFHCSAGKDRTGLGAALIFSILGVQKDVILGEYLMSNYYRNKMINKTLRKLTLVGIDQRIVQPLVEVKSSYLAAVFEAIDRKYGSMGNFLEREYDLTNEKIELIRSKYLMPNDENVEIVEEGEVEELEAKAVVSPKKVTSKK